MSELHDGSGAAGERCRRCSECVGEEHHWMENDEFEEAGDPEFVCKHCDSACASIDDEEGFAMPSGVVVKRRVPQ